MGEVRRDKVAVVAGVTGGRHNMMWGALVALQNALEKDYDVVAYFGFSGGSIAAALMSSEMHKEPGGPEAWIKKSTPYGKYGKIGGCKLPCNLWNLFRHGGMLYSKTLYLRVFKDMFSQLTLKTPVYMGAWSPSSNKEILLDAQRICPGKGIASSAALPFAISPFQISNRELLSLGYGDVMKGISSDPDGYSFFADGGISSALGVGIIDEAEAVQKEEAKTGFPVPVIGINIDPITYDHSSDFKNYPWYKKIWESCWGTVRSNVHDDIREAESERALFLSVLPTEAGLMKFATKFDASFDENMMLYKAGYNQCEEWLSSSYGDYDTPIDAIKAKFKELHETVEKNK